MTKLLMVLFVAMTLAGTACDDVLGTSSSDSIQVQMSDDAITADPASTLSGANTFEVTNNGKEPHDFSVLMWPEDHDLRAVIIGELGELQPDETGTLTVTLEEGTTYQLASLRVVIKAGDVVSDYDRGMQLDYDVE